MALFATRDKMPGKLTVENPGRPDVAATLKADAKTLSSCLDLAKRRGRGRAKQYE